MSRRYPALDVIWPLRPDDERVDQLIAEVDDESPTAVQELDSGIRIFFPSSLARGRAAVRLVALEPDLSCEPVEVPDDDWAERSQASLQPIRVGRIVVTPPWATEKSTPGVDFTIVIQPSMGFGTGHHASTRLCLRLLQMVPLSGASVLDIGTGSGVLALAAAGLGASGVLAVDHDQDALASARENIALNPAGKVVTLACVDLEREAIPRRFDLLLANLTGSMIGRLAPQLEHLLVRDGHVIVSGVMIEEFGEVERAFSAAGLIIAERLDEDEWVGLMASPSPNRPERAQ